MGNIDFDNLMYEGGKEYTPMAAYVRSKLANLLFTYELQGIFQSIGSDAIAVAAHPGGSNTSMPDHLKDIWYWKLLLWIFERMAQSAAMGALPTLRAAVDANVQGGEYYGPGGFMERGGYPVPVQSNKASHNTDDAAKLWQMSEELTGVRYSSPVTA